MSVYDEKNKLWYPVDQPPKRDFKNWSAQIILNKLSSHGHKVAQINDETGFKLTYHEIRLHAIRAAQNLLKRGFKTRDVFGFMVDHSDYLVPIVLASACLACPMAPLHPTLSKDEIVRYFLKSKPTVAFCEMSACDQLAEALKELPFSVKVFTFGGQVDGFEPVENLLVETGEENDFVPITIDADVEIGSILCSSGTTGPSKSIKIPFSRTINLSPVAYDSDNVSYCDDSIYWGVGMMPICHGFESGETRVITTAPFTPETPLQIIDKHKVTVLSIATFDLIACLKTDLISKVNLSSVKILQFYGSKMPNDLVAEVHRYFPNATVISMYGMTEVGTVSAGPYNFDNNDDGGNALMDGCIAKIADKNGNRCGPNQSGELCLKKRLPFLGYIDDPTASADAVDDDGFYRTGDIAYFDDNGQLFLQDRIKNVLTLFYFESILLPAELEECLINMPGVQDVCVVGVPIASGAPLPAAVVIPKPNSNLTKRDVFNKIEENFPKRSWLRAGVYFVDSLPKTKNGKLIRREITKTATQLFEAIKKSDADIQSYILDIPEAFRKLI